MLPPLPITVEEARERQASGGRVVFLDARTPDSWDRAGLPTQPKDLLNSPAR